MDTENYMNEKSAFIAIVGRPNVGKSSILNRLLGTKLAIVSNKPQTTRTRIMGVWTEGETQLVFIDTPGLIKPKNSLGDYMVKSVTSSVADVDACLLVVEANTKISKADEELVHRFKDLGVPALLAINKIDLLQDKSVLMEQIAKLSALYDFEAVVPVSAQDGNGMDALREELIALAEPGGHFFSEDTLAGNGPLPDLEIPIRWGEALPVGHRRGERDVPALWRHQRPERVLPGQGVRRGNAKVILLRAGGVKSAACFFDNFSTAAVLCYSLLLTLSLSRCPKSS